MIPYIEIKREIAGWYSGMEDSRMLTMLTILFGIALAAIVSYYVARLVLKIVQAATLKSATKWDEELIDSKLAIAISQLSPALVISYLLPGFFTTAEQKPLHWLTILTSLYILVVLVRIINIFISNLYTAMSHRKKTKPYAVKGIFQMLKLISIGLGIIYAISLLIGKQPVVIFTALGASAAVLMLVFQDTILGFVASIQLTANKMLHRGDWIISEQHKANGEVEDVSLTTVKVRNWDNSVSTIPPYQLISSSFRNYQPMRRKGGRLVDRSIYIDVNSVRFLTEAESTHFGIKSGEVNLGYFRKYMENYLRKHPDINEKQLLMVRQMEPTQGGLPIQLFFYTKKVEWKAFEDLQSEIFDHVYAIIHEFGLRIFQYPSGEDLRATYRYKPHHNHPHSEIKK